MISVLNSVSSLVAENALSSTQTSLASTLQQLSTGLRINSGANDPAGLSIANGLGANIAALTQSSQNASNGVGLLQTADGALSQVTSLLNQAVTIATEASNGGLTTAQSTAANTEFTSILNEINQIGNTTNFNGKAVFSGNTSASETSTQASLATTTALTAGQSVTIADAQTGGTFKYTAAPGDTIAALQTAVANAVTAGTLSAGTTATITAGKLVIATSTVGDSLAVSSNDTILGQFNPTTTANNSATVYTSDGTSSGSTTTTTTINTLSAAALGLTGNLSTAATAQAALATITAAINTVAGQRGSIGASVNQLTADEGVQNTEVQNLTSAQNNVQNADIGQTVANMTQYNVLEQTGMAAMSQSNQAQQAVLTRNGGIHSMPPFLRALKLDVQSADSVIVPCVDFTLFPREGPSTWLQGRHTIYEFILLIRFIARVVQFGNCHRHQFHPRSCDGRIDAWARRDIRGKFRGNGRRGPRKHLECGDNDAPEPDLRFDKYPNRYDEP
jgi:flagellin